MRIMGADLYQDHYKQSFINILISQLQLLVDVFIERVVGYFITLKSVFKHSVEGLLEVLDGLVIKRESV
ncbi:hypothetical protein PsalMR5_00236 [Piscirickettsia salmonis]|uniref:hypothetical protein n=1 Tax=Piscirickettsia salmonis TaxID=1238 RepID=UPI0012BACFAC|nr:hypothetical protein [Piscirickettsia salmonis]QGP52844.1 hypothetical protein PsalSR1_00237 [Piscirickettsia salmonis]QGP61234.1 hypothetical protein PsalBI1_03869 [Piscirickettsia salmonis]QGP62411.1 hypothetical protein PsalMR5_00236 [Piscirickettsia salmonis]